MIQRKDALNEAPVGNTVDVRRNAAFRSQVSVPQLSRKRIAFGRLEARPHQRAAGDQIHFGVRDPRNLLGHVIIQNESERDRAEDFFAAELRGFLPEAVGVAEDQNERDPPVRRAKKVDLEKAERRTSITRLREPEAIGVLDGYERVVEGAL